MIERPITGHVTDARYLTQPLREVSLLAYVIAVHGWRTPSRMLHPLGYVA